MYAFLNMVVNRVPLGEIQTIIIIIDIIATTALQIIEQVVVAGPDLLDALKEEDRDNVIGEASLKADTSEVDDNHSSASSAASSALMSCCALLVLFSCPSSSSSLYSSSPSSKAKAIAAITLTLYRVVAGRSRCFEVEVKQKWKSSRSKVVHSLLIREKEILSHF